MGDIDLLYFYYVKAGSKISSLYKIIQCPNFHNISFKSAYFLYRENGLIEHLEKYLNSCKDIQEISLSKKIIFWYLEGQGLTALHGDIIAKALENNNTVKIIDFSISAFLWYIIDLNNLGDEGLFSLVPVVATTTNIIKLNLSSYFPLYAKIGSNGITDKKIREFAAALEKNTTLSILNLGIFNLIVHQKRR